MKRPMTKERVKREFGTQVAVGRDTLYEEKVYQMTSVRRTSRRVDR